MRLRNLFLWALALGAAVPPVLRLDGRLQGAALPSTGEAAAVERVMAKDLGSPFARFAVLVVRGLPSADSDSGRAFLRRVVDSVAALPFVRGTISPATSLDTMLVGAGGDGAILVAGLDPRVPGDSAVDALRVATAGVAASRHALELLWTGEDALDRDLRAAGAHAVATAELRALPLSLLVALWAFRGVTGALIATITGGAAVLLSLAGASVLAAVMPLTLLSRGVASLLALALGLDYAPLVLWRYREEGSPGAASAIRTVRTAALAVGAGVAPLVLIPVPELRTAGVAALVAVGAAALAASTLTPALLGLLRAPAARPEDRATRRWRPFIARVLRHPVLALLLALPPLLALAWPASRLRPAVHAVDWLPRSMESARALDALASMQRLGAALGLRVLLVLPAGSVLDPPGWEALERLHAELERNERVTAVRSLVSATGGLPVRSVAEILTDRTRQSFLSPDGRIAVLELAAAERLDPRDVADLVTGLRTLDAAAITGVPGARLLVGGAAAANVDYSRAIVNWLPLTGALVLAASLTVLALAFRSVLVPLKAVALNLLSVCAALGAATLVFQEGFGAAPLGGLFPTVLVLAFCAAFGAGTDYEVFVVSRVAALRAGLGEVAAIREGVARSGGVITGAAAVMVAVFAVFATADFAPLRVLGFVLAVAITLDATVVRMVIAPALLTLAGRWNWWPRSPAC